MKRRTVLKALAGGCMVGPAALAGDSKVRRFRLGKGGVTKKLVVVFQRGGNDGLNTMIPVSPSEYGLYSNLRPTLRIPNNQILNIPGTSFFGLHPRMSTLIPIINTGNLSLIHAVGYPGSDRSHFESQSYYETAVPGNGLMDGWLNRFLNNTSGGGLIRGLSIGGNIPQSVTGPIPVPVSNNFGSLGTEVDYELSNSEEDQYVQKVKDLFSLSPTPNNSLVYSTGDKIFQMIDNFSNRNINDYVPENGANYPLDGPNFNTGLGWRMMHAAQMLKESPSYLGVEVVTIDQGGYDNHANQAPAADPTAASGTHASRLLELSNALAAFYTDMGPALMDDTIVLVVSEFGRRAYQNDSNGTDHGTGSLVMVMGNSVNGSIINGGNDWPGLANLYQNDDLMWVTDFRDIYWEILSQHMGVDNSTLQTIIPGHTYNQVGFMS